MQTVHSESYDPSLMERLLFRVAKKWVAGFSSDDALKAAIDANRRGMSAIINFLGEDTMDKKQVNVILSTYLSVMDLMKEKGVKGCVSVKPTQLGLAIDYESCLQNCMTISAKARSLGQFLWLDMESAKVTEDIITIYLKLFEDYTGVGVALQAYLKRSASDLLHILEHGGIVRLVKGAYHEGEEHVFTSKEQIYANYVHLLEILVKSDNFFAIGTHDSNLIDKAMSMGSNFEFQLLMGIRDELKSQLVSQSFRVAEYIPYGSQWLPYSVRRIRERKRNLLLLARSLVQQ